MTPAGGRRQGGINRAVDAENRLATAAPRDRSSKWSTTGPRPTRQVIRPRGSRNGSTSATATCSSPPSRRARTRRTRACCSPPACSPRKPSSAASRSSAHVKTSLAPGSRVVTDYLTKAGLLPYLEQLGFGVAPTAARPASAMPAISRRNQRSDYGQRPGLRRRAVRQPQLRGAHPSEPQGELPGVAAAGRRLRHRRHGADIDLTTEPLGNGKDGPVFLKDIWPTLARNRRDDAGARDPRRSASSTAISPAQNPMWNEIPTSTGQGLRLAEVDLHPGAAVLRRLQDEDRQHRRHQGRARSASSATRSRPTTSRPPARSRRARPPANTCWRTASRFDDFNSYGSRRGNHEVMMRGTFANVRIKNLMLPPGRRHARGRRRDAVPAVRREDVHLRRGDEVHRAGHADGRLRRRGIRHRLIARLGGQRHAAARREGGHREELRAHPPLQPGRHGRAAAAVQGGHRHRADRSASTATRPSTSSASPPRSSRSRT